jgi:hypothetical protein
MNWEIWSTVAEIIGAAAVVVSLIYVSRQISMGNRLARAEAGRTPTSDLNMLNASFGTNKAFRSALRKALEGVERADLDPDARVLLDLYFVSVTRGQGTFRATILSDQLAHSEAIPQLIIHRTFRETVLVRPASRDGLLN